VNQIISDALPQSMPELESPFRVWQEGDLVRFAKDPVPLIAGAKLTHADSEALPTQLKSTPELTADPDPHKTNVSFVAHKQDEIQNCAQLIKELHRLWPASN
jgi:hypothetical protein